MHYDLIWKLTQKKSRDFTVPSLQHKKKNITLRSPTKRGGRSNFVDTHSNAFSLCSHSPRLAENQATHFHFRKTWCNPPKQQQLHQLLPPFHSATSGSSSGSGEPPGKHLDNWIQLDIGIFGTPCSSSFKEKNLQTLKKRHLKMRHQFQADAFGATFWPFTRLRCLRLGRPLPAMVLACHDYSIKLCFRNHGLPSQLPEKNPTKSL